LFYIRANKSSSVFEQIKNIQKWETIEINYKEYEVSSIPFMQFFEKRNYRLVIMREPNKNGQTDMFTGDAYTYRTILTNDLNWTEKEIIEFYNARGASEKIFDEMNNDFGWKHLPFSFLNENNTFMIITAMIKNFYNYIVNLVSRKFEKIKPTSRLKTFVFQFITVAGRWVYQARQWVLKLFTKKPYNQIV